MDISCARTSLPADEPGAASFIQAPNPRRSPPRQGEILDARKRQKVSHSPEQLSDKALLAAAVSLRNQRTQGSSSDASASKWFDTVNKNVSRNQRNTSGYDDEPPFFVGNRINHTTNNFEGEDSDRVFGNGNTSRLDSENEDLRGVIDDLTVENRKLKQLIRVNHRPRRTPVSDAGQQDKLFEVRMHGLPPEKRRELEHILKNFATSVHTSVPSLSKSLSHGSGTSSGSRVPTKMQAGRTDSGYASNSGSGQTTGHHSQGSRPQLPVSQTNKTHNIKNYLHDIPDPLLPRQPLVMSERSRMALVVRRLEQLFTGKGAAPGEHSQPVQQQEVSQMAARADLVRDSNLGQRRKVEGSREAHIMPPDTRDNLDSLDPPDLSQQVSLNARLKPESTHKSASDLPLSCPASPEQRPTRPLDLDIHRAQIAAENIEYIRHLGLSAPYITEPVENEDSTWIYLNLLSSMAQLHTINVTPDFVRRSIKQMSKKFELSKDGHRVRWIGGPGGTQFSKEEEKSLETAIQTTEFDEDGGTRSSRRSNTNSTSNVLTSLKPSEDRTSALQTTNQSKEQTTAGTSDLQIAARAGLNTAASAFDYKPIVYRERPRDNVLEDLYLQDTDSSADSFSRDSVGLANALSRSNLNQSSADEGMITFYNNPHFCSDFTGDSRPTNMQPTRPAVLGKTLGIPVEIDYSESGLRYHDACYFAQQFAPKPYLPAEGVPEPTLHLPIFGNITSAGEDETTPIELEACGLGGVSPEDNFAVDVQVAMSKVDTVSQQQQTPIRRVPQTKTSVMPRFSYRTESTQTLELLPSKLPPPSYIFFTSSSSSDVPDNDDASDDSDATSSAVDDDAEPAPPAFLMHWSADSSGDQADIDDDDVESSSMDMLSAARKEDPKWIAQQERQYVLEQPPGMTIAGSLAATVGTKSTSSVIDQDGSAASESGKDSVKDSGMDLDE